MVESEDLPFMNTIKMALWAAIWQGLITAQERLDCRRFLDALIEERDALRDTVVRQGGQHTPPEAPHG